MSTTECGSKLVFVEGTHVTQRGVTGMAILVLARTKSVWRALRNRMVSNCLRDLDAHLLDDIGITRSDVTDALDRSGVFDDPSILIGGAAHRRAHTRLARLANTRFAYTRFSDM